jgi:hypothetical protein
LENKLGNYQDKDNDGYVAWYPDPKKPNEPAGAGVNQSIIDSNDADANVGVSGQGATSGVSGGTTMQYSAGVYPIYTPGKPETTTQKYVGSELKTVTVPGTEGTVEYVDRAGLKQWLNKNLDTATIKSYQQTLKSLNLLPKNYVVNGKIDLKGQFAGAIVKIIQNQQDRQVDAETLADGIEFVKQNYAGSGTGEASLPTANITAKEAALADIQDTFNTTFGVAAPKEIINAYRDELKALELSRTSKRTTSKGVAVGTYGVSEIERKNVMNKYINQYATIIVDGVSKNDPLALASLQKGEFGLAYSNLRSVYADNGIPINNKTLAQLALDSTANPEKAKANINLARLQAKTFYPALANQIDNGYTVKQLLSPYLQTRANILEEDPDSIDIKELTKVASDPKGLMGLYDYEVSLRNDPKWRFTKNAQDSISNVASGIAEMFGLVG